MREINNCKSNTEYHTYAKYSIIIFICHVTEFICIVLYNVKLQQSAFSFWDSYIIFVFLPMPIGTSPADKRDAISASVS